MWDKNKNLCKSTTGSDVISFYGIISEFKGPISGKNDGISKPKNVVEETKSYVTKELTEFLKKFCGTAL